MKFYLNILLGLCCLPTMATGQQASTPVTVNLSDGSGTSNAVDFSNSVASPTQSQPVYQPVLTQQPVPSDQVVLNAGNIVGGPETGCGCAECQAAAGQNAVAPEQKKKPSPCGKSHNVLLYKSKFDYLNDPDNDHWCLGDRFKQLKPRWGTLDIGGQIRYRYHNEVGLGQQAGATRFQDTTNDFALTRIRLFANWQVNDRLRLYVEGIHSAVLDANAEYIPRGIDRNHGDFQNLFADIKLTERTTFRVGRQELLFGSQRFVSPLDWANVRRTFDGFRTITNFEQGRLDAFYTQAVPVLSNDLDGPNDELEFYGAYFNYTGLQDANLDLYYLGLNNTAGPVGVENINHWGIRLNGKVPNRKLLYDLEAGYQSGFRDLTAQDIEAYTWTLGLGRSFADRPWKPAVWFFYDYASGDDPNSSDFEQFNDLFPLGHKYHGFIDAVQRRNLISPNVRLTLTPRERLSLLVWYHNFQSEETSQDILSLGGTPAQDPTTDDFGNEIDFIANLKVTPRATLSVGYSHFFTGAKILNGSDADFFYLQWQHNF